MPHGYTLDMDGSKRFKYSKRHQNGETTVVEGVKKDIPGSEWEVDVTDPRGGMKLGNFGSKSEAKNRASSWMQSHKKGVPGSGKDVSGASSGIPGMDSNGLF